MYLCLKDIRSNVSLLAVIGNFRPALRVTHLYGHILSGICQRQPRRRLAHGSPNVGGLSQPNLLPGHKSRSLLLLLLLLLLRRLLLCRCLGCCGMAPVMMVNEDVYGSLTGDELDAILAKYE